MGWSGEMNYWKLTYQEIKKTVMNKWNDTSVNGELEYTAEKAAIRSQTAYIMVRKENKNTGEIERFIAVTLFQQRKYNDNYEFLTKELTESSGPGVYDCPVSYIHELGGVNGTDDQYAQNWRENVIKHHEARKKLTTMKKSGEKITVQLGNTTHEVQYSKYYDKWLTQKMTYLPKKYINPYTTGLMN